MEKIIVVDKAEVLQGTKGDYLQVTDKDGKKQNIFDQSLWGLFQDGMAVKLTLEKQGRWNNVTGAVGVAQELAEKSPQEEPNQKARSMSLSYSKDVEIALIRMGNEYDPSRLFNRADIFYSYMIGNPTLQKTREVQDESKRMAEDTQKPAVQGPLRGAEDKPVSRPTDEEIKARLKLLRDSGEVDGISIAQDLEKKYGIKRQLSITAMLHSLEDKDFWEFWDSLTIK